MGTWAGSQNRAAQEANVTSVDHQSKVSKAYTVFPSTKLVFFVLVSFQSSIRSP